MSVDQRGYHYRYERHGSRIKRIYVGKHPPEPTPEQLQRQALSALKSRDHLADEKYQSLAEIADKLGHLLLFVAGYHQHHRGEWRRKSMPNPILPVSLPKTQAEMNALIERASKGDESTVPTLREWMRREPSLVESFGGDLPRTIERNVIDQLTEGNVLFREALQKRLEDLRNELTSPQASGLERLLIDRVALAWLRLHEAELRVVSHPNDSPAALKYREDRIESLNKQFLLAAKSLAAVRKLAIPVLVGQINVAARQVNQVASQVA